MTSVGVRSTVRCIRVSKMTIIAWDTRIVLKLCPELVRGRFFSRGGSRNLRIKPLRSILWIFIILIEVAQCPIVVIPWKHSNPTRTPNTSYQSHRQIGEFCDDLTGYEMDGGAADRTPGEIMHLHPLWK
jgi:hypothetical protein